MSDRPSDTESPTADGLPALHGIRVLDFSRLLPGPFCSQVLADLGAEVIRIDDATRDDGGDLMREEAQLEGFGGGEFFHLVNRGKKSLALNLRDPRAVEIVKRLVRDVDVVLEGFRPGVMDRLGVGYSVLSEQQPRLVYCAISGYGQTGRYAHKAGHDLNYQALSGALHHNASHAQKPAISGLQMADLGGGAMTAVAAILAALLQSKLSGRGRFLDVSMTDGLMAMNVYLLSLLSLQGREPEPGAGLITGGAACYQVYPTQDGRWLAVGALEQKFWAAFCQVIGREDLVNSGHLLGPAGQAVIAEVSREIQARPIDQWAQIFADQDCCVTPVMSLAEALEKGPTAERGLIFRNLDHRPRFHFPVPMQQAQANNAQAGADYPKIGAHTAEVLRQAGVGDAELQALRADGVIR